MKTFNRLISLTLLMFSSVVAFANQENSTSQIIEINNIYDFTGLKSKGLSDNEIKEVRKIWEKETTKASIKNFGKFLGIACAGFLVTTTFIAYGHLLKDVVYRNQNLESFLKENHEHQNYFVKQIKLGDTSAKNRLDELEQIEKAVTQKIGMLSIFSKDTDISNISPIISSFSWSTPFSRALKTSTWAMTCAQLYILVKGIPDFLIRSMQFEVNKMTFELVTIEGQKERKIRILKYPS